MLKVMEYHDQKLMPYYSFCLESIMIVTGPSFINATCILAPNSPVFMVFPKTSSNVLIHALYKGMATSGFAALM